MSRITQKLSKIFDSQIPEFIRVGESSITNTAVITTTASSKRVTISSSENLLAGDRLAHPSITNTVFITKILSSTEVEVSDTITVSLSNQVARFIRADATSNFVKFLEAYYKFLEQDQQPQEILQNARLYADSDYTIDSLIEQFFRNYGNDIPRNIIADKRTFIKHFKDLYTTKGTEEGYRLLFRVMFGEDVNFFYPDTVILKASDGIWKKDKTIRVIPFDNSNIYDFVNTKIIGAVSNASAIVNTVNKIYTNTGYTEEFYELSLEDVKGEFLLEEIIAYKLITYGVPKTTLKATTVPQLTKIRIIDGANGYEPNAEIRVQGANVKIESVNATGKIKSVKVINPGVFLGRTIIGNVVSSSSFEPVYIDRPTLSFTGNVNVTSNRGTYISTTPHELKKGATANLYFYGNTNSAINNTTSEISVSTVLDEYRFRFVTSNANTSVQANLIYTSNAILESNLGVLRESSGYWLNSQGKLSELVYIEGPAVDAPDPSKIYYQPFSYVVKSKVSLDNWKNVASGTVHPAGMQVFSEIDITTNVDANVSTTVDNEIWDYLYITSDWDKATLTAGSTEYSDNRIANLAITADHVFYVFNYL